VRLAGAGRRAVTEIHVVGPLGAAAGAQLAQLRYRERKRARASDLEEQAQQLLGRGDEMQNLQARCRRRTRWRPVVRVPGAREGEGETAWPGPTVVTVSVTGAVSGQTPIPFRFWTSNVKKRPSGQPLALTGIRMLTANRVR